MRRPTPTAAAVALGVAAAVLLAAAVSAVVLFAVVLFARPGVAAADRAACGRFATVWTEYQAGTLDRRAAAGELLELNPQIDDFDLALRWETLQIGVADNPANIGIAAPRVAQRCDELGVALP